MKRIKIILFAATALLFGSEASVAQPPARVVVAKVFEKAAFENYLVFEILDIDKAINADNVLLPIIKKLLALEGNLPLCVRHIDSARAHGKPEVGSPELDRVGVYGGCV